MSADPDGSSNGHDYVGRDEFELAYRRIEALEAPMLALKADSAERLRESRELGAKMQQFVGALTDTNANVALLRERLESAIVEVKAVSILLKQVLGSLVSKKKLKKATRK